MKITTRDQEDFQFNGAICLRQVLKNDEIELLRTGIELNLANPGPLAKIVSPTSDPGFFIEDFCTWQTNPHYKQFIFSTKLAEIAAQLMESKQVRLYHDHLLVKEPATQQHTPWHQDQPYYNISGMQTCSMWIPVDAVSRESTLEFVAGTHRGPWLMPRSFITHEAKWFPEGALQDIPDVEANREQLPVIGWEINPGDIVCFHMLTLHAAKGVSPNQRRRVFSVRFTGDDVRHAPRPWKTSPDFPGLIDELPANAPLEHPLFPLLWNA